MTPPAPPSALKATRTVIGTMTGTSLDGIDIAAVEVDVVPDPASPNPHARFLGGRSASLGPLADPLRRLACGGAMTAQEVAGLALDFGRLHAEAIAPLAAEHPPDLIALHGQTVHHAPPASWQLVNPFPVASAFGVLVVCDLRGADLALGGQGAPITPLADWVFFRSDTESRATVNLGGFCNVTLLPRAGGPEAVRGRDVCACNQLLDAIARTSLGAPFDAEGAAALRGRPDDDAERALHEALLAQRDQRRSLGTGDELAALAGTLARSTQPDDLAASACRAIARVVGDTLSSAAERVLLAGGGVHNRRLCAELERVIGMPVGPTDALGLPAAFREAAAIGGLGSLARDGVPVTLAQVTGRGVLSDGSNGRAASRAGLWTGP